ncbi:50S ribosomal protein L11 methyltransferase [Streptomyces sp. DT193]|uniref:50S ribosomal protein L11 methyltransferase n=1 Tax=Streptomyces sp. DT193 TaxID=3393418 RepID=UPI003CFB4475
MAVVAVKEHRFDESVLHHPNSRASLRELAGHLTRAGFDEYSAAQLLGAPNPEHLIANPTRYAFFTDATRPAPPTAAANVLTSLFILNRPLPSNWVRGALDPELVDLLRSTHLLTLTDDVFRGRVSLTPYRSRYFLSDQLFGNPRPQVLETHAAADLVMPPHASTLIALDTVAAIEDSFLDVGCGSGFLALNADREHGRRAGIDLNPRCVAFASANAELNGEEAVFDVADFATHTLPATKRYGALLFNAPTRPVVDSADGEFGQTTGEHVIRTAAAVTPQLLRPDGTAHVLTLIEVPKRFGTATDIIHHWLADTTTSEVTVTELENPQFSVTARQMRDRKLHAQSVLVHSAAQAEQLVRALEARDVVTVALVRVSLRPSAKGGPVA